MKKGFSVVKIILSVFVLGVIGGGGYTAYKYFTDPAFDFYGLMGKPLIPKVLANNVMGQNADAILLYRSSDDLNTYINSLIPAESNIDIKAEDVLSAIFLVRGPDTAAEFDGAGMAAIEFASVEKSAYVSGQLSALSAFVPIKSDLKDNVLVISVNAEEDTFSGPIGENPLLKKVDPDFVDSQVMLFADTQAFKELQMLFLPIISGFGESMNSSFLQPGDSTPTAGLPVAHAQLISPDDQPARIAEPTSIESAGIISEPGLSFLLNFSKFNAVYFKFEGSSARTRFVMELVNKSEISSVMPELSGSDDVVFMEKVYDASIKLMDEGFAKAKEEATKADSPIKEFNFERNGNVFTLTLGTDMQVAKTYIEDAQAKSRDAARKADLNNMVAAIESYNGETGAYPAESMCVDKIEGMGDYYFDGAAPVDAQGAATFGSEECAGGYYYSAYVSGYALWAKMEKDENGNSADFYPAPMILDEADSGPYFVLNETGATGMTDEEMEMWFDDEPVAVPAKGGSRGVKRVTE